MTSFESKTVRIAHSSERVFELLSDLSNLERFKGALNAPGNEKLKITGYDKDSLSIEVSPIGSITFRIIDREPNKTIKFEAENSPLPLKAELNPFIKPMVSKPLQEGVDKMADMLVILPYE